MIVKWKMVAAYSDVDMCEGNVEVDENATDTEIQTAVDKEAAHCIVWERPGLKSDGWYDAGGGKLDPTHNIWEKAELGCRKRLDTFVEGFSEVKGLDEDGIPYQFNALRVMKYFDGKGTEIPDAMEILPWYNGSEVRNVEISDQLRQAAIEALLPITFESLANQGDTCETKKLWMRMGCTINLTEEEIEQLKSDPQKLMANLMESGRIIPDGETYFPGENEGNQAVLGEELEFNM